MDQLKDKNDQLQNKLADLNDEIKDKDAVIDDLRGKLNAADKAVNDLLGSEKPVVLVSGEVTEPVSGQSNKPTNLISDVVRELQKQGVGVTQNKNNGSLVLAMDESFYFAHDSALLNKTSREKLNKVFPMLMKHITKKLKSGHRLRKITISGHASPIFSKVVQSPDDKNSYPYQYNLRLSKMRAKSVKDYLLGTDISTYQSKHLLPGILDTSGFSYGEPVEKSERTKADDICGGWDCRLSRRVEIGIEWNKHH